MQKTEKWDKAVRRDRQPLAFIFYKVHVINLTPAEPKAMEELANLEVEGDPEYIAANVKIRKATLWQFEQ